MEKLTPEKMAEKMANEMADFVNSFSPRNKEFIIAMCLQHRTLQQSFGRLVMEYIFYMATQVKHTDPRNEATVKLCREILNNVPDFEYKKNLPFI